MSSTTVSYKLYMYADQPAPGVGYCCTTMDFTSFTDALKYGKSCGCQMFEIQSISTTVTEPSKKNPQGSTEVSKHILERFTNYPICWNKKKEISKPELRWNIYPTKDGGSGGYMKLRLESDADAINAIVLTRRFGQGFCFIAGRENIMWAKGIKGMSDSMKTLQKAGYIDRRQIL